MGKLLLSSSGQEEAAEIVDATLEPSLAPSGEIFYNNGGRQVGTATSISPITKVLNSGEEIRIPSGILTGESILRAKTLLELTGDATAESGDIMSGVTAYVDGQLVLGSYVPLDTSDATARVSDILVGKTAYKDGSKITGTMKDYSGKTVSWDDEATWTLLEYNSTVSTSDAIITVSPISNVTGKYDGYSKITARIHNLIPSVIRSGVVVGRDTMYANPTDSITGTFTSDATITSAQVLEGYKAYGRGEEINGSMSNITQNSAIEFDSGNGTKVILSDALLVSTNTDGVARCSFRYNGVSGFISTGTLFALPLSDVASGLGITSDKIVTGNTICGVSGTAITASGGVNLTTVGSLTDTEYAGSVSIGFSYIGSGQFVVINCYMSTPSEATYTGSIVFRKDVFQGDKLVRKLTWGGEDNFVRVVYTTNDFMVYKSYSAAFEVYVTDNISDVLH